MTPNGYVYDFFTAINVTPAVLNIGFVWSSNKGIIWSAPIFATDIQVVGVVSPDSGQPLRDASILYSIAVNPISGAIYLAWQDFRFSTHHLHDPDRHDPDRRHRLQPVARRRHDLVDADHDQPDAYERDQPLPPAGLHPGGRGDRRRQSRRRDLL